MKNKLIILSILFLTSCTSLQNNCITNDEYRTVKKEFHHPKALWPLVSIQPNAGHIDISVSKETANASGVVSVDVIKDASQGNIKENDVLNINDAIVIFDSRFTKTYTLVSVEPNTVIFKKTTATINTLPETETDNCKLDPAIENMYGDFIEITPYTNYVWRR